MKRKVSLLLFVLLGILAAYLLVTRNNGTIKHKLCDFAISDTSCITKMIFTSYKDHVVTLERTSNGWIANDKYPAREELVRLILKTLNQIEVKEPVSKINRETILQNLTENSTRVEINMHNNANKVFYIGETSSDMRNTCAVFENASDPFYVEIPGFNQPLSMLFSIPIQEWKTQMVFHYNIPEIASITFENHLQSQQSFSIEIKNGEIKIFSYPQKQQLILGDTLAAQNYVLQLRRKDFSKYITDMTQAQQDSVKSSQPIYTLTIQTKNDHKKQIKIFTKPGWGKTDAFGEPLISDPDLFCMLIDNQELVYAKYIAFDPLFKGLSTFIKNKPAL